MNWCSDIFTDRCLVQSTSERLTLASDRNECRDPEGNIRWWGGAGGEGAHAQVHHVSPFGAWGTPLKRGKKNYEKQRGQGHWESTTGEINEVGLMGVLRLKWQLWSLCRSALGPLLYVMVIGFFFFCGGVPHSKSEGCLWLSSCHSLSVQPWWEGLCLVLLYLVPCLAKVPGSLALF